MYVKLKEEMSLNRMFDARGGNKKSPGRLRRGKGAIRSRKNNGGNYISTTTPCLHPYG